MLKVTVFAALLLVIGMQTSSTAIASDDLQTAGLYTACAPIIFTVADLSSEGEKETGLTKQAVVNAVESRLRGARQFVPLEKQNTEHQIRLQNVHTAVSIYGPSFGVMMDLQRLVEDTGYELPGIVTVWNSANIGTHGGQAQFIHGVVSQMLDEFIVRYLQVNEAYCSR